MFPSVEIRWFRHGLLPSALEKAVASWPIPPHPDNRTDTYLIDPTSLLGVKLRAGASLEIKQRQCEYGVRRMASLEGCVEGWAKWAFALEQAPPVPPPPPDVTTPSGAWIEVEKRRFLHKYEFLAGGGLRPVGTSTFPTSGASFELTALALNAANWWTLAVESFGMESMLTAAFDAVLAELSRQPWCPELHLADSLSYPAWLRIAASGGTPDVR